MTEKNADVEWLRRELDPTVTPNGQWISLTHSRAVRLLDHIDQLEARLIEPFPQIPRAPEYRPTVHEIAVQMMAAMLVNPAVHTGVFAAFARQAYDAAEALVAEGRRRDGMHG